MSGGHELAYRHHRIFPWRRLLHQVHDERRNAGHHVPYKSDQGPGPGVADRRRRSVELPPKVHYKLDARTSPSWPTTSFAPRITDKGAFPMFTASWPTGAPTTARSATANRRRPDHAGLDAENSGLHAQLARGIYSVPAPGTHSAPPTAKALTSGRARTLGRCTESTDRELARASRSLRIDRPEPNFDGEVDRVLSRPVYFDSLQPPDSLGRVSDKRGSRRVRGRFTQDQLRQLLR